MDDRAETRFVEHDALIAGSRFVLLAVEPAQHGFDPCDHFTRTERFADVIIGAEFQTEQAIDFIHPCGHHDDRQL